MIEDNSKKLIEEWAAAWSSEAPERFLSLFVDDCIYENVAAQRLLVGKAETGEFYRRVRTAFPDFKLTVISHVWDGSHAAAAWVTTGTQHGALPEIPATGRAISLRGASIFELDGDSLKRCTDHYNRASMLKQLGL
ncbi:MULTISPECIES: ester cyclase [Rhodomicrobium]|uniref:ester cyclase n=1 Tax=Rhodomicrobium TaxID=1068 RepID=UPI001481F173|nr:MULTISPECIES: ester cyclase [Rhodomicrobium]